MSDDLLLGYIGLLNTELNRAQELTARLEAGLERLEAIAKALQEERIAAREERHELAKFIVNYKGRNDRPRLPQHGLNASA